MQELTGTAFNLVYHKRNDKFKAMVEAILVLSEPAYSFDAAGQMVRQRTTSALRFFASPAALREFATQITTWADEAESSANDAHLARRQPPPECAGSEVKP